jgi:TPR repeat protein
MRRTLAALLTAMLAGLVLTAPAARAEDAPIPRIYPSTGFERASTWRTPEDAAREKALADGHEAECNSGAMAGCLMLGTAFETGKGRPQSRPVAELLYREACTGGLADSCARLGKLLRSVDAGDTRAISAELFVRACRMGSATGCEAQADDLAAGVGGAPDPAAARALLRATCDGGSARTCNRLAGRLIVSDTSEADRAEGLALLDRQCRAGNPGDCSDAARYLARVEGNSAPIVRTYDALACDAGDGRVCALLGTALMRGEWQGLTYDDPRTLALGYFDRACTLSAFHCQDAAMIRDETQIVAACAGGEREACERLAGAYGRPGGPLEDLPQAAALLGWMCDRATSEQDVQDVCARAGDRAVSLLVNGPFADPPPDPARVDAHLTRACTAGSDIACGSLAEALANGAALPQDLPRALALDETRCEAGKLDACDRLGTAIMTNPAAPLLVADGRDFPPPEYSPEEITAMRRVHDEETAEMTRQLDEAGCTTTDVEFRGTRYIDTLCMTVTAVINAFTVKAGTAPWQALIWRPKQLGRFTLSEADRVLCGGAVIRTGWVLTAAHCLVDADKKLGFNVPINSGQHRIRLGVYNPLAPEGYLYRIRRVFRHPRFNPGNFAFDIALIQYDPAGEKLGEVVHPVARIRVDQQALPERTIVARMPAYTFGWGRTALEGASKPPSVLRGARLELRDMENCTRVTGFRDDMRGAVLCAAGARGEQACFGDSGGPLISYAEADDVPTVIGVVSAGVKCGRTSVPSRFTRIGHRAVREWLRTVLPSVLER